MARNRHHHQRLSLDDEPDDDFSMGVVSTSSVFQKVLMAFLLLAAIVLAVLFGAKQGGNHARQQPLHADGDQRLFDTGTLAYRLGVDQLPVDIAEWATETCCGNPGAVQCNATNLHYRCECLENLVITTEEKDDEETNDDDDVAEACSPPSDRFVAKLQHSLVCSTARMPAF